MVDDQGHILLTSRNRALDRLGSLMEIPVLSVDEGISLLLRGYTQNDIKNHIGIASSIVDRLGGLALAIDQASAYIRYKHIPLHQLDELLVIYDKRREKILSHTPAICWEYGTMQIHGEEERNKVITAFTTWEISLDQLQNDTAMENYEIIHFLTLSAFFNPAKIEEAFFSNYWGKQSYQAECLCVLSTRADSGDEEQYDSKDNDRNDPLDFKPYAIWDSDLFWDLLKELHG